jgi:hypothetical protein
VDKKLIMPLGVGILGVVVWYLWTNEGETHNVSVDAAYAPINFDPYAQWATHGSRGKAYVHHYPETVAPNCIPLILQTEDGAISTTGHAGLDMSAGQNGNCDA